jgi:hypothetical protein
VFPIQFHGRGPCILLILALVQERPCHQLVRVTRPVKKNLSVV